MQPLTLTLPLLLPLLVTKPRILKYPQQGQGSSQGHHCMGFNQLAVLQLYHSSNVPNHKNDEIRFESRSLRKPQISSKFSLAQQVHTDENMSNLTLAVDLRQKPTVTQLQ